MDINYYFIHDYLYRYLSPQAIEKAKEIAELSKEGLLALIAIGLGGVVVWLYKWQIKRLTTQVKNGDKRVTELEKESREKEKEIIKWQVRAIENFTKLKQYEKGV